LMEPHGVAVFIRAKHMCVEMRGVREISPATRTTVFRGVYSEDPALRSEFLNICGLNKQAA
jgi:GTP cyclohydrolase I